MKKLAYAFIAATTISSLGISTAGAMTLGSLSREHQVIAGAELTTSSIPHGCGDFTCGAGRRKSAEVSPAVRLIFISIGSFVRSHIDIALEASRAARVQLVSMASAD
jgi:hypothetical protein